MEKVKLRIILGLCLIIILFTEQSAFSAIGIKPSNELFLSDQIILVLEEETTQQPQIDALVNNVGAEVVKVFSCVNAQVVKLPPEMTAEEAVEFFSNQNGIKSAELDYIVNAETLPNDTFFGDFLWGLHNTGQTHVTFLPGSGTPNADIAADEAWDSQTDCSSVVVAVIDSGVDYNHPDLADNMWENPGEIPGNLIDDDGNGYVDDVYGINAINNASNPGDPMDDHFRRHGTHVAGTIGAIGNNGLGVTGVCWDAQIMALKFLNANGSGCTSDAITCIQYMIDMKEKGVNVKISNSSWGGGGPSLSLKNAMSVANDEGILFVAAAGNRGLNTDNFPFYPSSYDLPSIISVAATDRKDLLPYFSNFGNVSVDISAPGVSILSTATIDNFLYIFLSGTSMAAPHVSGAAALIYASSVTELTPAEVKNIILVNATGISSLGGKVASGGRLNIESLICPPDSLTVFTESPSGDFSFERGEVTLVKATVQNCGNPVTGATVDATFSNGDTALTLFDDGLHDDGAASDGTYANNWTPLVDSQTDITFNAVKDGFDSDSAIVSGEVADRPCYEIDDKVPFNWVDVSDGTEVDLSDDAFKNASIGFDFEFFGNTYNSVEIHSNGYLLFKIPGSSDFSTGSSDPTNSCNSLFRPHNIIAPFWDDLNPTTSSGTISYKTIGVEPNRQFVVEYFDIGHFSSTTSGATFEVILDEADNSVKFQYQDTDFENIDFDSGASATVGIENVNGTEEFQYSCNNEFTAQAIKFSLCTTTLIDLTSFTAEKDGGDITLQWQTGSEIDNAGFYIRRSESEEGEYIRINNELILAKGGSIFGADYSYTDKNVVNGKTYYYMLEDVELDGKATLHGPISIAKDNFKRRGGVVTERGN